MAKIRLAVTENVLSDPARVTTRMYQDYLHLLGRGWVCCRGREIVGFAYASRHDASIWALFVKPRYEGRGIGGRLMSFAVDWLFALGCPSIVLFTGSGTRADRFYGKSGWIREGVDEKNNVTFRKFAPSAQAADRRSCCPQA
jgi:GNAT superfamily N-acetyltransferase